MLKVTIPFICAAMVVAGCQNKPDEAESKTKSSPDTERTTAERPADARSHGGHWYKVFEDDQISWHAAKKKCEEMGGYLVCIETKAEQDFIADLCDGEYYYLGGTDEAAEGEWKWVNGSPWKFTYWMEGQPNNYGDDENCLATYDGGEWVDVAAEGDGFWMPIGYICEWEK